MLDLRAIFTKYRVQWRDRGSNCSRGNINIPCPFCRFDPSCHLSISEDGDAYYCLRDANHAGRNLYPVFKLLKIPLDLLPKIDRNNSFRSESKRVVNDKESRDFISAAENKEAVDYLLNRKFSTPRMIATTFRLQVAPMGKWAGRLIIPLTEGWTGRSMRKHIQPRYLAETNESGFFLFKQPHSSSVVIFEGALDAMRVASISTQFDVMARCGNKLSPALQIYLAEKRYHSIYFVPDNDVPYHQVEENCRILSPYALTKVIHLSYPPEGVKDICELSEMDALNWLATI